MTAPQKFLYPVTICVKSYSPSPSPGQLRTLVLRADIWRPSLLSVPVYVETGGAGQGPGPVVGPSVLKPIPPPTLGLPPCAHVVDGQGGMTPANAPMGPAS